MNNPFDVVPENTEEPNLAPVEVINDFHGINEFLSNFFAREFTALIEFKNESGDLEVIEDTFNDVEHAFQAWKTLDRDVQKVIRDAGTAGKAKRLGRKAKLRPDWEDIKVDVMFKLVQAKFQQHPDLKMRLLATGDAVLVEGNTWNDVVWGVNQNGVGENHLGKILMRIRDEIRAVEGDFKTVFSKFLDSQGLGFVLGHMEFNEDNHG